MRIFSQHVDPGEIGRTLAIEGTRLRPIQPASKYKHERDYHHWSWSTEKLVEGADGEVHLSAITSLLHGKREQLDELRAKGCDIDIFCYWVSSGQGGPSLNSELLLAIGGLGLSISWDVYFGEEADYKKHDSPEVINGA